MGLQRIYVTKKKGFTQDAERLIKALQEELSLPVKNVTLYERYDIEGLSNDDMERAKRLIFSEPPVDDIFTELPITDGQVVIGREFLPGQYDQRADSAAQCLSMLTLEWGYTVRCASIMVVDGSLTNDQLEILKHYYINPVDSKEASPHIPTTLAPSTVDAPNVSIIEGFRALDAKGLEAMIENLGLAMTINDLTMVLQYYIEEDRDPTMTEIRLFDTYWSDHCRHTTFMTELSHISVTPSPYATTLQETLDDFKNSHAKQYGDTKKKHTLMGIATLAAKELRNEGKLEALDESDEINACTIKIKVEIDQKEEDWLLLFKNETHNHPTEIEPFGGAATCLGGCIRDPLSGRAYVYQAMRVTGAADPLQPISHTLPGKLPQRVITQGAAKGYSSYGNQIGLATGEVHEYYHPGYVAKRMEVGAVLGAVPSAAVRREKPAPGDVILLVGGDTGRDGCGGATGSSKEHTLESLDKCGAEVQKGNPLTERKIQRLFRRPDVTKLIKRCNDFGAGGVSVAIGELADSLRINLDAIPKKYAGLDGTELAISESQERMACVLSAEDVPNFLAHCHEENVKATVVAEVTNDDRLTMTWKGQEIVNISRAFLDTNGAPQKREAHIIAPKESYFTAPNSSSGSWATQWTSLFKDLNVTSQQGLSEQFDSTVGAGTVLMPFGGMHQKTPVQGMVAKIPVLQGQTTTASIMTQGFDPYLSAWSPYHGAQYAVLWSIAKLVSLGGKRQNAYLTLQEYFEKLGDDPDIWGKPVGALLGAYKAQKELSIGAIGGKDSMSGTFIDITVPPTLISFAVTTASTDEIISPEFKGPDHSLLLFTTPRQEDDTPHWEIFRTHCDTIQDAHKKKHIYSAYALGNGGLAEGIGKCAFGNSLGVDLMPEAKDFLFNSAYGSFLVEVDSNTASTLAALDNVILIGHTKSFPAITMGEEEISLSALLEAYEQPLTSVFPLQAESSHGEAVVYLHDKHSKKRGVHTFAKPKVLIPVFPGTNCEYDSARAFENHGAIADIFVVRNQTVSDLEESVQILCKKLQASQILMLAGGFSAGDEPDGAGKFMATLFRNPYLAESLHDLLYERDGLALGICNGFQALMKLGLLPGGGIQTLTDACPTLTYNTIGRHISRMVRTKIISVKSPWMSLVEAGEIYTVPISHGEGRFIASPSQVVDFNKSGQIATQYVDQDGVATYDARYNPNQSVGAIEGLFSPDGRVFGKMAHIERAGADLAQNIPGNKIMPVFESGVSYFK